MNPEVMTLNCYITFIRKILCTIIRIGKQGRKPVWVPGRCAENEILYPGDNQDDWVCDCKPAYIFHPDTGSCYMPYNQGPCEDGKYLVLKKNKVVPECAENPCKTGEVKFKGQCHPYGKSDACNLKLSEHLEIDAVSLRPKCVRTSKSPLLATAIEYTSTTTAKPSKISIKQRISSDSSEVSSTEINLPKGAKEIYRNAPWCQKGSKRRIINSCSEN
ncbi:uncharacterized protein LOC129613065 isoform X2 [Condylostylus longicornis]|uniref:uncharacterized protein LOC129613065 isoform X2 n=1 Tax=Condylostylus longicornis TaxID=2530218 RepID=UPI00244DF6E6|nr:uncharacterized protein LOC129613065 isoform X2 [Condylostylus longicornis]